MMERSVLGVTACGYPGTRCHCASLEHMSQHVHEPAASAGGTTMCVKPGWLWEGP